jgi:ubiquinone/menaquinone biosynthesis C-methylase UbiE
MSETGLSKEHKEIIGSAEKYERDKVPGTFYPLALLFIDHVPIQKGDAVLDVACGTGIVARVISEQLENQGDIVGVDIDQDMIDFARTKTPADASISWHVGNANEMPFLENNIFDWVVCQQGFQFFKDKAGALNEIRRVLKPDGGLAMVIWRSVTKEGHPYYWAIAEAHRKFVGPEAGDKFTTVAPFYDGTEEDLYKLMKDAGFHKIHIENIHLMRKRASLEECILEEDYADLDPGTRKAVVEYIRKELEPFRTDEGSAFPYGAHLVIGYKSPPAQ